MFALAVKIVQNTSDTVVMRLFQKNSVMSGHFLFFLSFSVFLVVLAKLSGKKLITTHGVALVSTSNLNNFLRDGLRLGDWFSVVLIINSIFSTAYVTFLFLEVNNWLSFGATNVIALLFLSFVLLFVYQALSIWLVFLLTGEKKVCMDHFTNGVLTYPLRGLLLLPFILVLTLNTEWREVGIWIAIGVLLLFQLVRIIRCSLTALVNKVSWYYIILYFCTLEILPLVVIYYSFVAKS
jgi:hypothetical protein